jgi:hypothetical protein
MPIRKPRMQYNRGAGSNQQVPTSRKVHKQVQIFRERTMQPNIQYRVDIMEDGDVEAGQRGYARGGPASKGPCE